MKILKIFWPLAVCALSAMSDANAGIFVPCGANIQSYVNAWPGGTAFQLPACTYWGQTLYLAGKDGDSFNGAGQEVTILDGAGTQGPFLNAGLGNYGGTQTAGVTFANLTIRGYAQGMAVNPDPQTNNTCAAFGSAELYAWEGWLLDGVTISGSQCVGVDLGHDAILRNSLVTGNGMVGVNANNDTALPGTVTLIGNEISYNNTRGIGLDWDSGGVKVAYSATYLNAWNNYIHDNNGAGFWCDVNCSPNLNVQGNTVVNNTRAGIMKEITIIGSADISRNVVNKNPIGIFISSSSNTDVHDNSVFVLSGGFGVLVQADPGRIDFIENDAVHNNTITFSGPGTEGFRNYAGVGASNVWSDANAFYVRKSKGVGFAWGSPKPIAWSAYRNATGQDAHSTLVSGSAAAQGCQQIGCSGSGL